MARNNLKDGYYVVKMPSELIRRCFYIREELKEKGIAKPLTVIVSEGTERYLQYLEREVINGEEVR